MTPEATPQSSPTAIPETKIRSVVGIWIVPITPEGEIFAVRNNVAKFESQKVPGQLNCPAETYKPFEDLGSFRLATIPRAIEEEIGELDYDPTKVKALPFINLLGLGKKVVAAPYLIPVVNKKALKYNPKDPNEADNPQWIHLDGVNSRTINIGPYRVPLFRLPMVEIAEMIQNPAKRNNIRHCTATIGRDVYRFLEENYNNMVVPDSVPARTAPKLVFENPLNI